MGEPAIPCIPDSPSKISASPKSVNFKIASFSPESS